MTVELLNFRPSVTADIGKVSGDGILPLSKIDVWTDEQTILQEAKVNRSRSLMPLKTSESFSPLIKASVTPSKIV